MSGSLGPLGWAWPRNIAGNAIGWGADGVTLANIPMESRNLYYFDAVGDGVTDDTDAVQAAFDWVAGGGLAGRALNITSGQYLLLDKVSVTVPNHTTVALHGSGGQAGTILVGNATGGIELLCSGSAPFVTVEKFAIVPAMAGAGFLLRVKGTYSGSGGGIGHNTVVVRDMEFSPLQRTTSTYYSLNPLDFEKMKRPYIERIVYRPGTQAPAYYGDYLVNLSDCYSPVIKDYVLGGYARIGIKAHHSVATEGFLSSHGRLTNCLRGIWYQSSPQPGVIIENTHINSSEGNIIIDGAQRFRVSGNLLYSNNSKVFSWTRSGNTLTVTCDPDSGGVSQTNHNIANGLNVRLGFNVADIENPDWDGDEDGTADGVPSGTFAATYINDGQFSVTDIGFGGLAASGTVDVRWAEAPFEDIWIKNGTLGLIHGNLYGHQASRLRRHVRLDDTDTAAASPKLSGITCVDDMISARTSISPYYVGDICRNIVGRVPDVWAEELGIVAYPETLVEVDSAARDVAFQTSLDTFETRYVNGLVNAVPNGKFARGSMGWDEGSGWTVAQNTSEALSGKSALQYLAPNTSNSNFTFGDRIACRADDVIHLEWFYKVTTGTVSLHRARATFYDAAGAQVGSTLDGVSVTSAPSSYTRRTQEFPVPATAVSCELLFRIGASTGATIYIDEISAVVLGPGAIFYNPEFATRAEFVTAVAAGLALAAGRVVVAEGLEYKRTAGATAISDLTGYLPAREWTAHHFGAVFDGATNTASAIQAMMDGLSTAGGGTAYLAAGTAFINTQLLLPTKVALAGAGIGVTVLKRGSSIGEGNAVIRSKTVTADAVLGDADICIRDLTIDQTGIGYQNTWLRNAAGTVIADPAADYRAGGCLAPAAIATVGAFTFSGGAITGLTITSGGSGYTYDPHLWITGDGFGARINLTVTAGAVTGYTIADGGKGYTTATGEVAGGGRNPRDPSNGLVASNRRNAGFALGPNLGNSTGDTGYNNNYPAIQLIKTQRAVIDRVKFLNVFGNAIQDQGSDRTTVKYCEFSGGGKTDGPAFCMSVTRYSTLRNNNDAVFEHNVVKDWARGVVIYTYCTDPICRFNRIENVGEGAITSGTDATRPRVYGNHVKTVNITDLVGSFAEVSNDIELIDNTIEDCATQFIGIDGTGSKIIGNTLKLTTLAGVTVPFGPYAERVGFSHGSAAIAGCQVAYVGSRATAIRLFDANAYDPAAATTISRNRIVGPIDYMLRFLHVAADPNVIGDVIVEGNDLSGGTSTLLYDPSTADLALNKNKRFALVNNIGTNASSEKWRRFVSSALSLNNNTSAQPWFSTSGTLNVRALTSIRFEADLELLTGTSAHDISLTMAGTATLTSILYDVEYTEAAVNAAATAGRWLSINQASATAIVTGSTAARKRIRIKGVVVINAGGTFIPQLTFSAAPGGTNQMGAGSYMIAEQVALSGFTAIGDWS